MGLVGIYFLIKPDKLHSTGGIHANLIGTGLIAFGNFSWAIGTLLTPRLTLPRGNLSSGIQMLVGGFILLLFSLLVEPVVPWSIVYAPTKALGAVLYLVIFGSIIGFSSYSWLARNAPPQLLSTYAFSKPSCRCYAGDFVRGGDLLQPIVHGRGYCVSGCGADYAGAEVEGCRMCDVGCILCSRRHMQ